MNYKLLPFGAGVIISIALVSCARLIKPCESIITDNVVFEEKDGLVYVEAEHFIKQSKGAVRRWYRFSKCDSTHVGRDDDPSHWSAASNSAYVEVLPDTRVTHDDALVRGENFSQQPGVLAVLHYKINFMHTGRYYVWVRTYSTGSEDNGIHVGLDGEWPEHGQRMQWCEGKGQWTWGSRQRTKEEHCGIPGEIYLDIYQAGVHEIQFSMREDGFEFDQFMLVKDLDFNPGNY